MASFAAVAKIVQVDYDNDREPLARQLDSLNCTLALSKAFEWFNRHVFNFPRRRQELGWVG
jgi:hypothetical protein